MEALYYWK